MSKKNKKKKIADIDIKLTPEEEAAIDRALSETAKAETSEVDFDAIHDAILKKARAEGVVVFAKPKKKERTPGRAKRIIAAVSAAAAVFIVGFAAFAVLRNGFGYFENMQSASADDNPKRGDAVVSTDAPNKQGEIAAPTFFATELPVYPTAQATEAIDVHPVGTPIPTEYAMKDGSLVGYIAINCFTVEPPDSVYLIPELMPEFVELTAFDASIAVSGFGKDFERTITYKCRVTADEDLSLGVGWARYKLGNEGEIELLWRVTEDCWLSVNVSGFKLEETVELLKSIPLCDPTSEFAEQAA